MDSPDELKRVECPEPVEGLSFVYILRCRNGSLYVGHPLETMSDPTLTASARFKPEATDLLRGPWSSTCQREFSSPATPLRFGVTAILVGVSCLGPKTERVLQDSTPGRDHRLTMFTL